LKSQKFTGHRAARYIKVINQKICMSRKSKGMDAERDLVHKFWSTKVWAAIRVAGSGSMKYPSADIIATNGMRMLVIECKSSKNTSKYLTSGEVAQLKEFSVLFAAEPWIGVKFNREKWYFLGLGELEKSEKHLIVSLKNAKKIGRGFNELIQHFSI